MNKRQAKKLAKQRAQARAERSRSYASEYFRTGAEVQSAVNRINSRLRTIASHLGNDSTQLQNLYTQIDIFVPNNLVYYNKDKVLQIGTPYKIFKMPEIHAVISHFDKDFPTYGDIKAEYQKGYLSLQRSSEFFDNESVHELTIDQYIEIFANISDILKWASDNQDEIDEAKEILEIAHQEGGHTYEDFMRIQNLYRTGMTKQNEGKND